VYLTGVGIVHEPVGRYECPTDVGETSGFDHVVDDGLMVITACFGAERGRGQRSVLARCPPAETQDLLKAHRGAVVLVDVVELAAAAAVDKGPYQALVIFRRSKSNNTANITATIAAPYALQKPTYAPRWIAQDDRVNVADVDANLERGGRNAHAVALPAHLVFDALAFRCR
jgi:hypothetical protein